MYYRSGGTSYSGRVLLIGWKVIGTIAILGTLALAALAYADTRLASSNDDYGDCPYDINGVAVQGDDGGRSIDGSPQRDHLSAGGGDDLIDGSSQSDCLYGQAGADELVGSRGADLIQGGAGGDLLRGGGGDDGLLGLAGDDTIRGGRGDDTIDDREGENRIVCGAGTDSVRTNARSEVAANCETVVRGRRGAER